MFDGLRSRWTTPAECTYFNPRCRWDKSPSRFLRQSRARGLKRTLDGRETNEDLVKEVLDELLLEGPTRQETVEIGSEKLCNEVNVFKGRDENVGERDDVFVLNVLEELQFAVSSFRENGRACREGVTQKSEDKGSQFLLNRERERGETGEGNALNGFMLSSGDCEVARAERRYGVGCQCDANSRDEAPRSHIFLIAAD